MIAAGLIEYLLMIGIPFYGIAVGVWYIALTLRKIAKDSFWDDKKKNNLDKLPSEGSQGGHY